MNLLTDDQSYYGLTCIIYCSKCIFPPGIANDPASEVVVIAFILCIYVHFAYLVPLEASCSCGNLINQCNIKYSSPTSSKCNLKITLYSKMVKIIMEMCMK